MSGFAAELPVRGRRVLVVGGGDGVLGRVAALRAAGADVHVVGPTAAASIADLAERGLLRWDRRAVTPADVGSAALVILDDLTIPVTVAAQVRSWADEHGIFCLEPATAAPGGGGRRAGKVILVGGGPGDPGLLTVAGLAAIRQADVIVTDRLAPLAVLEPGPAGVEIVDVGKIPRGRFTPQERINDLLVEHARAGRRVVRLKGGDNFVFGRGGEEWQACAEAGIEVQVIPGVSSAVGVPGLAGIPLTHRTANQGFTVITAHVPPGDPRSTLDYAALAAHRDRSGDHDGCRDPSGGDRGADPARPRPGDAGGDDRGRWTARPTHRPRHGRVDRRCDCRCRYPATGDHRHRFGGGVRPDHRRRRLIHGGSGTARTPSARTGTAGPSIAHPRWVAGGAEMGGVADAGAGSSAGRSTSRRDAPDRCRGESRP